MPPGASTAEVKSGYEAKAALIAPRLLAGAPSMVVKAASRAQEILDAAWRALGDTTKRAEYDRAIGIRRSGGGLGEQVNDRSYGEWESDVYWACGPAGAALAHALVALADLLAPKQAKRHSPHIAVPDVRGLFFRECMPLAGKIGFRVTVVRLTEHPMPVDGLVVGQSPASGVRAHRDSPLTLQVWHPPRARP